MPITERQFLECFFGPDEKVCLRLYSDRKNKKVQPKMYRIPLKNLDEYRPEMLKKNIEENCGAHFVVNFGGHYDKYITRVNAVFFEHDNCSFDEQLKIIANSPIEPSIIVKTRKSLHCYFLCDDVPVKKFRSLQERLALLFGSDPQIKNESRTMRLPNFYHTKKDHLLVQVVKFDPHIRYTYQEINGILPLLPKKPKRPKEAPLQLSGTDLGSIIEYVKTKLDIYQDLTHKILCHCLFPENHSNGDKVPSAVFFKTKPGFYCSGCGTYMGLRELTERLEWTELEKVLPKDNEKE